MVAIVTHPASPAAIIDPTIPSWRTNDRSGPLPARPQHPTLSARSAPGPLRRACRTASLVVGTAAAGSALAQAPAVTAAITARPLADIATLAYLGAFAAIAAYHLLLNVANNDRGFVKFSLFALGMLIGQVGLSGVGTRLALWPADSLWASAAQPAGFAFAGLFAALHSRDFLRTGTRAPGFDRLIQLMAWIFATIAVGAILLPQSGNTLVAAALPTFAALALASGLRCRRLRAPGSAYYLVGWAAMLAGAAASIAGAVAGASSVRAFSTPIMQCATVLGMLLLSVSLAERTSAKWRERSEKQADTLSNYEQQVEALKLSEEHLSNALAQRNREVDALTSRLQDGELRELQMSHLDPLTGLVNHLLLADRIAQGIIRSKRHNTRVAVIAVEIDPLPGVREEHGAEVADDLLRAVAARLRAVAREQDTVARLENDEFVLVLEEVFDNDDLRRVINAIETAFVEEFRIGDTTFQVTATLGATMYPDGGRNAGALIGQATKLMRRAKRARRLDEQRGAGKGIAAA